MARRCSLHVFEGNTTKLTIGLLIVASYLTYTKSAINELVEPGNASCACLGDILTYICTAVGGGSTQWGGTAFNCPDTSNKIILSHTFYATEGINGACNNGAIIGRSLGVINGNCYISQLNVTVQKATSSLRVVCTHNSDSGPIPVDGSSITAVSDPYPPPSIIKITEIRPGIVRFSWDPVAPNCSSVQYKITSDCGVCPMTTDSANVTCSDQQIPSVCTLHVQSMICGFIGSSSVPVVQTLKFPDIANVVNIIPHYLANNSQTLTKITIIVKNMSDDILNVTKYRISYFDSNSINKSSETKYSSCVDSVCEYVADISLLLNQCLPISINISAINALGAGRPLQQNVTGCNSFVMVEYNNQEATFSCIFNDRNDRTKKSCLITYGQCGNLTNKAEAMSTEESPGKVVLNLIPKPPMPFCYSITATNSMQTIIMEGHVDKDVNSNSSQDQSTIIIAVTVSLLLSLLALLLLLILTLGRIVVKPKNKGSSHQINSTTDSQLNIYIDSHVKCGENKPAGLKPGGT